MSAADLNLVYETPKILDVRKKRTCAVHWSVSAKGQQRAFNDFAVRGYCGRARRFPEYGRSAALAT
jgi:hypothetical protein